MIFIEFEGTHKMLRNEDSSFRDDNCLLKDIKL